ncbi:SDR family oxidoreductase [Comamonas piscis]
MSWRCHGAAALSHGSYCVGSASALAQAVAFLASPRASYIHGADLVVDGGFSHSLMTHIPRAYGQGELGAGKAQPGLEPVSNR